MNYFEGIATGLAFNFDYTAPIGEVSLERPPIPYRGIEVAISALDAMEITFGNAESAPLIPHFIRPLLDNPEAPSPIVNDGPVKPLESQLSRPIPVEINTIHSSSTLDLDEIRQRVDSVSIPGRRTVIGSVGKPTTVVLLENPLVAANTEEYKRAA